MINIWTAKFSNTFEICKQSLIPAFSIYMAVPLSFLNEIKLFYVLTSIIILTPSEETFLAGVYV